MTAGVTPSQTIGPFFASGAKPHDVLWADGPFVVDEHAPGAIWVHGQVFDGEGAPVPEAVIETWQADVNGRFDHPDDPRGAVAGFRGFGRCPTDREGRYRIRTVKPGSVPGPGGAPQAPHIAVSLFARGLLQRLVTRIYFDDEGPANDADPVLGLVGDQAARATLLARTTADGYRFDLRLQGDDATVFFDL
jgi:protocatechuate 3,4-dioxygenase, alpha subunit